jgi:iron complex outermembrane receptor protein
VHQGYRLPTFTDLYYSSPDQRGNADLKPEESINTELGYRWNNYKLFFQSNIFYRYGYRMIGWIRSPDEVIWRCENLMNIATFGFDVATEYNFSDFFIDKVKLSYSYIDVKNHSSADFISIYTTNFLRHKLNLGVFHRIWNSGNARNNVIANWQFRLQSRAGFYIDAEQNTIDYPTFLLCDLRIIWQSQHFNFFIEGTNLFDREHIDFGNLPQPGIWLKAGISLNILQP